MWESTNNLNYLTLLCRVTNKIGTKGLIFCVEYMVFVSWKDCVGGFIKESMGKVTECY